MNKLSFAIDRGGTFTDCLVINNFTKEEKVVKVLSVNPSAYPDAPTECVRLGLEWGTKSTIPRGALLPTAMIDEIRIGTTVATNALLERKGAKFALVVTKGWKDLLYIGNQSRSDIFDLSCAAPDMLYDTVVEADERVLLDDNGAIQTPSGQNVTIRRPLSDDNVRAVLSRVLEKNITGIAVCLLHSATYPQHEIRVAEIAQSMGFTNISLSHVAGSKMIRAVPRGHSSCADAYLTPVIAIFVALVIISPHFSRNGV